VDTKEHLLAEVLGLVGAADQMKQDANEAVLVAFDQGLEGPGNIPADLNHEPDIRISCLKLLFQALNFSTRQGVLPSSRKLDRSIVAQQVETVGRPASLSGSAKARS